MWQLGHMVRKPAEISTQQDKLATERKGRQRDSESERKQIGYTEREIENITSS